MNGLSDATNSQSHDMENLLVLHTNPLGECRNLGSQGAGPTKRPDGWLLVGSIG